MPRILNASLRVSFESIVELIYRLRSVIWEESRDLLSLLSPKSRFIMIPSTSRMSGTSTARVITEKT